MILERPERLLLIALAMLLFGCIIPFLMVIQILESTFLLNFLSFGFSTLGLILGVIGTAMMQAKQRAKKEQEDKYR